LPIHNCESTKCQDGRKVMQWAADPFNFGSNPNLGLGISMYRRERKYFELSLLKHLEILKKALKMLENTKEGRKLRNMEKKQIICEVKEGKNMNSTRLKYERRDR
jgi:hypothetical protein